MGICGLNSFLKANPQLSIEANIHDQKLVIDGKNLAFHLFMRPCISARSDDWRCDVYGGNMVSYAEEIREFFQKMSCCNVEPIVVINGRRNIDDESTRQKVENQFQTAKSILENSQDDNVVVPSVIKTVFTSVLKELDINLHVANNYTATIRDLANANDCPVLTNDGAFFIYALKKGHILLDSFDYHPKPTPDGNGYCFSNCSIYQQSRLLNFFPKLNLAYLPLLAVSLTYSKSNNLNRVTMGLSHTNPRGILNAITEPQKRIIQLLLYIQGKPLKVILDFFLSKYDLRQQTGIWNRIQDVMAGFWSLNENDLLAEIQIFYRSAPGCDVAGYLAKHFTSGDVNTILYDIIVGQCHFNYPEIEDLDQVPSFHTILRPLSVVLALMKRPMYDNSLVLYDQPCCEHIVVPMDDLEGFGSLKPIFMNHTMVLPHEKKRLLVCSTFRFDVETYVKMTELMEFRMFDQPYIYEATICMLLLRYINREAKSRDIHDHVSPQFVGALLITILFYGSQNGNIDCPEGDEYIKLKSLSVKNSGPLAGPPSSSDYRVIMHLITELQTVYKAFYLLNTLLDYPFEQPRMQLFFNGVLIYRVTKKLLDESWDDGKVLVNYGFKKDCAEVASIVLA